MSEPPLIVRLSGHLQRPVPERVRQRARLHLLDWLACVAGARKWGEARGLDPKAVRWDQGAMLGNVLEMDDVHRKALLHPGPVIWAYAGEWASGPPLTMTAVLDDAAVGYEAMISVGSTFDAWHYQHYHPTTTAGVFGAAATLGRRELGAEGLAHALAFAGSVAGGLWQMRHTANEAKQWHLMYMKEMGWQAVRAALIGMTGPLDVLEGPQGLYAATCRAPKPMVLDPDRWRIEEVSFKPWAACRHAHPVIDAAMQLRAAGRLEPPFLVETYKDALVFCDNPDPKTELEAKFSLHHAIAVVAAGRDASPVDFTMAVVAELAPLREQVVIAEALDLTARYPAHFGARLNGFEVRDTLGDPERPLGEAQLIDKLRMLVHWGGLPPQEADRAAELALRGDDAGAIVAMLEEWLC